MGIPGLIPFLKDASRQTNISEFSGGSVAIDTYCWLHKGAYSCADQIIMGQQTNAYVKYCMKLVNMLLSYNIKPILVFDGRHLPAKAETEIKRRETREINRKKAAELIKMGKHDEGKHLLRRSLNVSHKMALEVIKKCQAHNVDCIVAPYEADAQLAYLNISGIADVVITEDSDLTLFGCKRIFFKMDLSGNGLLVEQERLYLSMKLKPYDFTMDKFRYMCILSGCDYLASLPGVGLNRACSFVQKNSNDDIYHSLQSLGSIINMKSLVVTKDYRDNFMRALITYKHQLVYCPLQRKQVRLHPPSQHVTDDQLIYAGYEVDNDLAWELALGNCDPFTNKKLHDFDPDKAQQKLTNHNSIWSKTFKINKAQMNKINVTSSKESPKVLSTRVASTKWQRVVIKSDFMKEDITPKKRSFEECDLTVGEMYKRPTEDKPTREFTVTEASKEQMPPMLCRTSPFKIPDENPNEKSPSLLYKKKRRIVSNSLFRSTAVIDLTIDDQNEFFKASKDLKNDVYVIENKNNEDCKENGAAVKMVVTPKTKDFEDDIILVEPNDKDTYYRNNSNPKNCSTLTLEYDDAATEFSGEAKKKESQSVLYENENVIQNSQKI